MNKGTIPYLRHRLNNSVEGHVVQQLIRDVDDIKDLYEYWISVFRTKYPQGTKVPRTVTAVAPIGGLCKVVYERYQTNIVPILKVFMITIDDKTPLEDEDDDYRPYSWWRRNSGTIIDAWQGNTDACIKHMELRIELLDELTKFIRDNELIQTQ